MVEILGNCPALQGTDLYRNLIAERPLWRPTAEQLDEIVRLGATQVLNPNGGSRKELLNRNFLKN